MKNYSLQLKFLLVFLIVTLNFAHLTINLPSVSAQTKVQPMMQVSPVILNISLSPGKTYDYKISVKNLLSTPLPLHAGFDSLSPADEEENGTPALSQLLEWVSIDERDMIIPAGETKVLTLTVRLPHKIPVGGYYGTLFFEPLLPITNSDTSSVQSKVGVIMFANVGVPDPRAKKAEITKFSLNKLFYETGLIETNFRVKNVSLYHFSAKPFIKIRPLFGPEQSHEIEEKIILPGKSRSWESEVRLNRNNPGVYKAQLAVSVGNGEQITKTSFFVVMPFYISLTGILLLLLIIFFIQRKRIKRKRRTPSNN